jgi:prolyl oligopeptidase
MTRSLRRSLPLALRVAALFALLATLGTPTLHAGAATAVEQRLHYPPARTVDQVDDYHGTKVADPYRWLEDSDSPASQAWIAAENQLTRSFLDGIPARERIRARLTELWNFPKFTPPFKRGERYFYFNNSGLQNQNVLFVQDGLQGAARVLLDPNTLSADGTVALAGLSISEDGRLLAWATADGGSDWVVWRVRDVGTGKDLPDEIHWSKFSDAAWAHDGSGFYYSAYDPPAPGQELQQANYFQKLFFHMLGTSQKEDRLAYERPDQKEWGFGGAVSEDGRWLIISISQGTDRRNRIYCQDLSQPGSTVTKLLDDFDASYSFLGNDGAVMYFRTDLEAPRGRVIAIDSDHPQRGSWRTIIAQGQDVLGGVGMIHDSFVASYLHDAADQVRIFALDGKALGQLELPTLGSVGGLEGMRKDSEVFYSFTSFVYPATIYRYDFALGKSTLFRKPEIKFDASPYETQQVFFNSKDGTRVPLFLVYKKGLLRDHSNPTYLYGYGGFDIAMTPGFSVSRLAWLEIGGVYAQASLRGGNEYGEEWHQAGMLQNKQNVFDDFIAAAEYLIKEGWTSTPKLAIGGGSNGGLLVGACVNQRPDLFGAAVPAVGVMDMLRFHKFTIGWAWTSDYGSSEDPQQFKTLYAYSPYHNIKPGASYPAELITTADHDDRVVPGHSFKYAARLQAAQSGSSPVLIRIQTRAGHGAGKPTAMQIEEQTDVWSFLVKVLGARVDGGT